MTNDTTLKERIRRGDIVIGVNVAMTSTKAQLEDILGKDDYSFIAVDSQHSPFAEHQLVELCATAAEIGIPVQFRIKHTRHAYLVGNLADLGPLGIEVPLVEEESVVEEALRWFYFPPKGRRSWIGASSYGFERGIDRLDYAPVLEQQRIPVHADRVAARNGKRQATSQTRHRLPNMGTSRPLIRHGEQPKPRPKDRRRLRPPRSKATTRHRHQTKLPLLRPKPTQQVPRHGRDGADGVA